MKRIVIATSMLAVAIAGALDARGNLFGQETCGSTVTGIAICLSVTPATDVLSLELRNEDSTDTVIDLGVLLANGARQYASAVKLVVRDSAGRELEGTSIEPAVVAGRLDPFIVPLPAGAAIRLPVRLSAFLFHTIEHSSAGSLSAGERYMVRVKLTGQRPSASQLNLDVKGLALMPYWRGTVVSNVVTIVAPTSHHRQ